MCAALPSRWQERQYRQTDSMHWCIWPTFSEATWFRVDSSLPCHPSFVRLSGRWVWKRKQEKFGTFFLFISNDQTCWFGSIRKGMKYDDNSSSMKGCNDKREHLGNTLLLSSFDSNFHFPVRPPNRVFFRKSLVISKHFRDDFQPFHPIYRHLFLCKSDLLQRKWNHFLYDICGINKAKHCFDIERPSRRCWHCCFSLYKHVSFGVKFKTPFSGETSRPNWDEDVKACCCLM